jgi:hypothetical protein
VVGAGYGLFRKDVSAKMSLQDVALIPGSAGKLENVQQIAVALWNKDMG